MLPFQLNRLGVQTPFITVGALPMDVKSLAPRLLSFFCRGISSQCYTARISSSFSVPLQFDGAGCGLGRYGQDPSAQRGTAGHPLGCYSFRAVNARYLRINSAPVPVFTHQLQFAGGVSWCSTVQWWPV